MAGERDNCRHNLHIRLVMISNNRLRRDLRACELLAKKRFRAGPIAFVAQEHIDRLCRKVDNNSLLSTTSGIFLAQAFQYMV